MNNMQALPRNAPIFFLSAHKMSRSEHCDKSENAFNLLLSQQDNSAFLKFNRLSFTAETHKATLDERSVESGEHLVDLLEPTPFPEGTSLEVESMTKNTFVIKYSAHVEPTPMQSLVWYSPLDKAVDIVNVDLQGNTLVSLDFLNKNGKRSTPVFCSPFTSKRGKVDPSVADQSNTTKTPTTFRPDQENRWDEQYASLLKFRKTHGHCSVPHTYKDDLALSRWAKRQRYQYKLKVQDQPSSMSDERQEKLESVGFVWDPQTSVWETRRQELVEYKKRFGNCDVPCRYEANKKLGTWVKRQRRQYRLYKEGKFSRLSKGRFATLTEMGFQWECRNSTLEQV